jgi:hypothetical protein
MTMQVVAFWGVARDETPMTPVQQLPHSFPGTRPAPVRRVGYAVAIVGNAMLVYVVHHLLEWGWPHFLSPRFDEVVPIITLALVASIIANTVFVFFDPDWLRALAGSITSAIGFVAALWLYQTFPFDFSTYERDWSTLARLVVMSVMLGAAIGLVVESGKLLTPRHGYPAR